MPRSTLWRPRRLIKIGGYTHSKIKRDRRNDRKDRNEEGTNDRT